MEKMNIKYSTKMWIRRDMAQRLEPHKQCQESMEAFGPVSNWQDKRLGSFKRL